MQAVGMVTRGIIFADLVPRVGNFELLLRYLQTQDDSDDIVCSLMHISVNNHKTRCNNGIHPLIVLSNMG